MNCERKMLRGEQQKKPHIDLKTFNNILHVANPLCDRFAFLWK